LSHLPWAIPAPIVAGREVLTNERGREGPGSRQRQAYLRPFSPLPRRPLLETEMGAAPAVLLDWNSGLTGCFSGGQASFELARLPLPSGRRRLHQGGIPRGPCQTYRQQPLFTVVVASVGPALLAPGKGG